MIKGIEKTERTEADLRCEICVAPNATAIHVTPNSLLCNIHAKECEAMFGFKIIGPYIVKVVEK